MLEPELRAFLEAHNIPLQQWGTGEAKTVSHLLTEIEEGETILQEKDGQLLRLSQACVLNVYYKEGARLWMIKEDRQVFVDGRVRVRDYMEGGLFEKMKPLEDAEAAARRALAEELGIKESLLLTRRPDSGKGPMLSVSFPGLVSLFKFYNFDVVLPKQCYKPEGYIEKQKDKSTYFVWTEIPDAEVRA